jgi:hypothetical protein
MVTSKPVILRHGRAPATVPVHHGQRCKASGYDDAPPSACNGLLGALGRHAHWWPTDPANRARLPIQDAPVPIGKRGEAQLIRESQVLVNGFVGV